MPTTVWKGFLSFGLVSFPIRLFVAARAQPLRFHLLHKKDQSRLKEVWFCAEENKPVDRADIVKGFEYAKDKYVLVSDRELQSVAPPTATTMAILQFVKADEVDPLLLEKSYYVTPEKAGGKPYGLLCKAMVDSGFYAVAKVALHGREHIVIIRPLDEGLVLHTMYFENELNKANKSSGGKDPKFADKEMELAKRLIETLASPFKPEQFTDEYRKNVQRLMEQKRKGLEVTPVKQSKPAQVVDILDALKRSLKSNDTHRKPSAAKKTSKRRSKAA